MVSRMDSWHGFGLHPSGFSIKIRLVCVQPPVFGPPFKLVSGDAFSAPSAVLPKVQEVDNSELNVV